MPIKRRGVLLLVRVVREIYVLPTKPHDNTTQQTTTQSTHHERNGKVYHGESSSGLREDGGCILVLCVRCWCWWIVANLRPFLSVLPCPLARLLLVLLGLCLWCFAL